MHPGDQTQYVATLNNNVGSRKPSSIINSNDRKDSQKNAIDSSDNLRNANEPSKLAIQIVPFYALILFLQNKC